MNFNENAPLNIHALSEGKKLYHQLPSLESGQSLGHLYMHWSVSGYDASFDDYNVCVSGAKDSVAHITQDPRHNAVEVGDGPYAAHTWHRNSHALGVAVMAMKEATTSDFGPCPVTLDQLEVMCAVIGALGKKYSIDCSDSSRVMTHAEAAADGDIGTGANKYFGERWDLAMFSAGSGLDIPTARKHGDMLRKRAHKYKLSIR